jgi:hypothetical protein
MIGISRLYLFGERRKLVAAESCFGTREKKVRGLIELHCEEVINLCSSQNLVTVNISRKI